MTGTINHYRDHGQYNVLIDKFVNKNITTHNNYIAIMYLLDQDENGVHKFENDEESLNHVIHRIRQLGYKVHELVMEVEWSPNDQPYFVLEFHNCKAWYSQVAIKKTDAMYGVVKEFINRYYEWPI